MLDKGYRESWTRGRSLLSQDDRRPADARSLLSAVEEALSEPEQDDPAARHRLARSRREAKQGPLLSALADPHLQHDNDEPSFDPGAGEHRGAPGDGDFDRDWSVPADQPGQDASWLPQEPLHQGWAEIANHNRRGRARPAGRLKGSGRLILFATLLGGLAGLAASMLLPSAYRSTAEVAFAASAAPGGAIAQAGIVTSGLVLNKVVDRLNLGDDPEFNGAGSGGGLGGLIRSLLMREDGVTAANDGQRHAQAVGNLLGSLTVGQGGGPLSLTITASTGSGDKSALVANTVADTFVQSFGQSGPDAAANPALEKLRTAMEAAAARVQEFRDAHPVTAVDGKQLSLDDVVKLDAEHRQAAADAQQLADQLASVRSLTVDAALGGGLPDEYAAGMNELRLQYLAIKREADRAAAKLGPRNPTLQALERQLADARQRIVDELRRVTAAVQADFNRAGKTELDLARQIAAAKVSGDDLAAFATLQRAAADSTVAYQQAQSGADGAVAGETEPKARVISKAYAALEPSGPSRSAMLGGGLALGLLSGLALAMTRRRRVEADPVQPAATDGLEAFDARQLDGEWHATERSAAAAVAAARAAASRSAASDEIFAMPPEAADRDETKDIPESPMNPFYADPNAPYPQQPSYPDSRYGQGHPAPYPYPPQAQPYSQPGAQPYPAQPQMAYPQPQPQVWQQPQQPAWQQPQQPAWQQAAPAYPYPPQTPPTAPYGVHPGMTQGYPQPQPQHYPQQPAYAPAADTRPAARQEQAPIEEIRASLREFRDAVRELTESRSRRRYF